jgi:hypothetical protein
MSRNALELVRDPLSPVEGRRAAFCKLLVDFLCCKFRDAEIRLKDTHCAA